MIRTLVLSPVRWLSFLPLAGAALVACSTAPSEATADSTDPVTTMPNGDVALRFLDTSSNRSGLSYDWDFCHGKADCGPGEAIVGVSDVPGGAGRTALCRRLGPQLTGSITTRPALTLDAHVDQRRAQRNGDWASGFYKLECGQNEYVAGVSEDALGCQSDNRFHGVICAAGSGLTGTCSARTVDGSIGRDDRGTTASGDWDVGAFKGECGLAQYVAGVSVSPSTGRPHSILCCDASSSRFDALDFMINTRSASLRGSDGSVVAYHRVAGRNKFYYVKGGVNGNDGRTFERYAFDGNDIWLERDTSWPDGGQYDSYDCVDPATHAYGSLVWAKRNWGEGERVDYTTQIIGFKRGVCVWSSRTHNNTNPGFKRVHRVSSYAIGGELDAGPGTPAGVVDAIGIDYGDCETHWYARGWGWVRWEFHDTKCAGRPGPDVTWNHPSAQAYTPVEACGDGPLPFDANRAP